MPPEAQTNPEAAALKGGLPDMNANPQNPPKNEGKQEDTKPTTITVGGKTFNSQADADAYFADLEAKAAAAQQRNDPPPAQEEELVDGMTLDELMYKNPAKYRELVAKAAADAAEKRLNDKRAQEENEKSFWAEYNAENPDLKDHDRITKAVLREHWDKYAKLSRAEAKKQLASDARKFLSDVRKAAGVKESEVPSGQADALGASNGGGTRKSAPQPVRFVDQVKARRRAKQPRG